MARLRAVGPLNSAARGISDRMGKRWVETTFNGVRLGERQLPAVYQQAVRAARLLGLAYMPEIYVSGDRLWGAATYGTDEHAAIVIGTALITSFRGEELLFVLAREMGHCRVGHALWKTVSHFLLGEQGPRKGVMGGGLLSVLSPAAMVEGALETPLLAWGRQAEITADRAALLAVGDEAVARRVLLTWSLRSVLLYRQINLEAWLEQQDDSDDATTKLSELLASPTPYITRRLKLLTDYARDPSFVRANQWLRQVEGGSGTPTAREAAPQRAGETGPRIRVTCPECRTAMRVPGNALTSGGVVRTRCPNGQCGCILTLRATARHTGSDADGAVQPQG